MIVEFFVTKVVEASCDMNQEFAKNPEEGKKRRSSILIGGGSVAKEMENLSGRNIQRQEWNCLHQQGERICNSKRLFVRGVGMAL